MSSPVAFLSTVSLAMAIRLLLILVFAFIANRILRALVNRLVQPAGSSATRSAQAREQQTREIANALYAILSKLVWLAAILTALSLVGIDPFPALLVIGILAVAAAFGARNYLRDLLAGLTIVTEDQFVTGDTVQIGDTSGRVESLTLRRTLLRDSRGALVTIPNGDIRAVANLSRDWSQTFVDVPLDPEAALERALEVLDAAAAGLRDDPAWSQALVDGPRILGVHSYDSTASVIRLQLRTTPTRQDEVARELRRRIQLEFQRQGIPLSSVQRFELAAPLPVAPETSSTSAG